MASSARWSRFWYLRLGTSAIGIAACVLLVSLWVRSYQWFDVVFRPLWSDRMVRIVSCGGILEALDFSAAGLPTLVSRSRPTKNWRADRVYIDQRMNIGAGFGASRNNEGFLILAPHWFLVLLASLFTASPWIKWPRRFNLRTVLIAMTLIAGLLGIAVISN